MEIYKIIADWTGWPIIVAIGIVAVMYGRWIMLNRIETLQSRIRTLEADMKIFSVDSIYKNLTTKLKLANENIYSFESEKVVDEEKITQLKIERDSIERELNQFFGKLFSVFMSNCEYKCEFCFVSSNKKEYVEMPIKYQDNEYTVTMEAICKKCGHKTIEISYPGGKKLETALGYPIRNT